MTEFHDGLILTLKEIARQISKLVVLYYIPKAGYERGEGEREETKDLR